MNYMAWTEFFKVKGEFAMRNLTVFLTILVASGVVIYLAGQTNTLGESRLSDSIFIAYLLAGGGVYSFGMWQNAKTERSQISADNPQPPTPDPVIPSPVTINTAAPQVLPNAPISGKNIVVKDMTVEKVEGDVKIQKGDPGGITSQTPDKGNFE